MHLPTLKQKGVGLVFRYQHLWVPEMRGPRDEWSWERYRAWVPSKRVLWTLIETILASHIRDRWRHTLNVFLISDPHRLVLYYLEFESGSNACENIIAQFYNFCKGQVFWMQDVSTALILRCALSITSVEVLMLVISFSSFHVNYVFFVSDASV